MFELDNFEGNKNYELIKIERQLFKYRLKKLVNIITTTTITIILVNRWPGLCETSVSFDPSLLKDYNEINKLNE